MSNPKRGELKIELGDTTWAGRVTLDTVMRIETALGKGIVKIAQSLSEGELTTVDLISVITPAVRAGGNNVTESDVQKAVWEAGLADGMRCVGEILAFAITGGKPEGDSGNGDEAALL